MSQLKTRRAFLGDVGRGMLLASLGPAVLEELRLAAATPSGGAVERITFGALEPLVLLLQETPAERLQPLVIERMRSGTELRTLIAAAALANARAFGGENYDGYHAFMALTPAYEMSEQLPTDRRALPVLKVLYRNATFLGNACVRACDTLRPVAAGDVPAQAAAGGAFAASERLRALVRARDLERAEREFARHASDPPERIFDLVQATVHDDINVHRVMLAWRAWDVLRLTGAEHAHTLLRQSLRFCLEAEANPLDGGSESGIRVLLPRLLEEHRLLDLQPSGDRSIADAEIAELARTIYESERPAAADAAAAAIAAGMPAAAIGEAISLAANRLVLRDPGRARAEGAGKPAGSMHGASVGVHASDAANAWRNIASVTADRSRVASLIVGAYHTAGQSRRARSTPFSWDAEAAPLAAITDGRALLSELDVAIRANAQARACAIVERCGALGAPAEPIFDLLLGYAVSEDGALHAEKYYRTCSEEFAATRPAFRWSHLIGLARVTASEYGQPAPGYREARELLGV
ncbi:MAG: hypothetical protein L0Z55_00345 [Planctomycetes bacterium]|nr:hypothetical protein [Planctomycetota bacterium]